MIRLVVYVYTYLFIKCHKQRCRYVFIEQHYTFEVVNRNDAHK